MARFATLNSAPPARSPFGIGIKPVQAYTYEGGRGFTPSDPHMELFNAAVSGMLADQFYESGDQRIERLIALVSQCEPEWLRNFISWLRDGANLRSAPIVLAAEYARAKFPNGRDVVSSALKRPDEPAEMLGYWMSKYGRNVPSRVKRGIADAVQRLYNENALMRWDGQSKSWRFGDVIEFVHPTPVGAWQSDLFKFALDRRRHSDTDVPESLTKTERILFLESLPPSVRRDYLPEAGTLMSWERLGGWLPGGMDAAAWDSVIPSMGYMALLRNLNNFDRAGIKTSGLVSARLIDEGDVGKSKIMPFRFLTAYTNLESDTYKVALAEAADLAVKNIPHFKGRTLIMVDCSGSMGSPVGAGKSRSPLTLSQAAAFMAEAIARQCDDANIVTYGNSIQSSHKPVRHASVLRASADRVYRPGGGTSTWTCTESAYRDEDRVIVITDEQTFDQDHGLIKKPVITWNLAGFKAHHATHGQNNRYLVAGYNDTALQVLPAIIATGSTGLWPWQV